MNELPNSGPATEPTLVRLRELRRGLLRLHKALLDAERDAYEFRNGPVNSGELLQLVISHEQFDWLHSVSELIVRIDEVFDAEEPATLSEVESLLSGARSLLTPSEDGEGFGRKYFDALQREPAVVLAHREVMLALSQGS